MFPAGVNSFQQRKDAPPCLADHEDKGAGIAQKNGNAAREFLEERRSSCLGSAGNCSLSLKFPSGRFRWE